VEKVKECALILIQQVIKLYQFCISPFFGPTCRFYPSCSAYSLEALEKYGFKKGFLLSLKRLMRCHPWNQGGVDFLPEK
jgi:putative membrane protein insertion efficiency factor